LDDTMQEPERILSDGPCGNAGYCRLNYEPHSHELGKPSFGQNRGGEVPVQGAALQKPFGLEPGERLPHGRRRNPELSRQLVYVESRTWSNSEVHNLLFQVLVKLAAEDL
jgi:hypothetical protein